MKRQKRQKEIPPAHLISSQFVYQSDTGTLANTALLLMSLPLHSRKQRARNVFDLRDGWRRKRSQSGVMTIMRKLYLLCFSPQPLACPVSTLSGIIVLIQCLPRIASNKSEPVNFRREIYIFLRHHLSQYKRSRISSRSTRYKVSWMQMSQGWPGKSTGSFVWKWRPLFAYLSQSRWRSRAHQCRQLFHSVALEKNLIWVAILLRDEGRMSEALKGSPFRRELAHISMSI